MDERKRVDAPTSDEVRQFVYRYPKAHLAVKLNRMLLDIVTGEMHDAALSIEAQYRLIVPELDELRATCMVLLGIIMGKHVDEDNYPTDAELNEAFLKYNMRVDMTIRADLNRQYHLVFPELERRNAVLAQENVDLRIALEAAEREVESLKYDAMGDDL